MELTFFRASKPESTSTIKNEQVLGRSWNKKGEERSIDKGGTYTVLNKGKIN